VVRLALSTSYWPIVWPAPQPVRLTVFTGASSLVLPVRPPHPADTGLRPFLAPEHGPPLLHTLLHPARLRRTMERNLATNETTYTVLTEGGEFEGASIARVHAIDLEVGTWSLRRYRIGESDPTSAHAEVAMKVLLRRGAWSVRVEVRARMRSTATDFVVEGDLEAFEGDVVTLQRHFDERIPRDLV
jgi:hypothetical protein